MDAGHFGKLARTLLSAPSRRAVLPILVGLLATSLGPSPEIVGRRKGGHKRKKGCKGGQRRCRGTCIPQKACCTDAECAARFICQDRACVDPNPCPPGQQPCGTLCLQPGDCCTDAECAAGEVCENTICTTLGPCTPGLTRCGRECVDLTSDPDHCGACGRACEPGQGCVDRVVVGDIVCCSSPGRACGNETDPICCRGGCDTVAGCGFPAGFLVCCLGSGDACSSHCDCCGTLLCQNGQCT